MVNYFLGICLIFLPNFLWAKPQALIEITVNQQAPELVLDAKQAYFQEIITQLSKHTGVIIHADMLPAQAVTKRCNGTLKQVLDCLVQGKVDMVEHRSEHTTNSLQAHEIWLLGSLTASQNHPLAQVPTASAETKPNKTNSLLDLAKSDNPDTRADAISALVFTPPGNSHLVQDALADALADPAPKVRAQAVASMARRAGRLANPTLRQALQDNDASVRLMAIDHAGDNLELLQQALTDADPTVRKLAVLKLAELPANSAAELH